MLVTIGKKTESDFDDPVGMLRDCHKRIIYFVGALAFAAKKFNGLPLPHDVRSTVLSSLRYFHEAAPNHNADEEQSLFPRMRTSIGPEEYAAVLMQSLEGEHRWAESQHEVADNLFRIWISNGCIGEEESETLVSTLTQLQEFYAEHIRHEEVTIFPLAEDSLSTTQVASIGVEMATRRGVNFPRPGDSSHSETPLPSSALANGGPL